MRKKIWIISVLALALASCMQKEVEMGVSWELAQERKATIENVVYALSFVIPEAQAEKVEGTVDIGFDWVKDARIPKQLVIDFRGSKEQIKAVRTAGRKVGYTFSNEHIIINTHKLSEDNPSISVDFVSSDASLNRNPEFLYTLAVPDRARTIYPCFDQPNLKAVFNLKLRIPAEWEAVSNAQLIDSQIADSKKELQFAPTALLSTYLFAFSAGKWQKISQSRNGRVFTMFHRETDPKKLSRSSLIFDQIAESLAWLEDYTGVAMPFPKYDFVVVPGFQFGGMEHPGVILFNDRLIFLSENSTFEEEEKRRNLISHETSHLWFGDSVTMDWFDDVWTKEIFANYFASCISPSLSLPSRFAKAQNADNKLLTELKQFYVPAYETDRSIGSVPIKKKLDNLKDAGLVYDNIIYFKAPIVMSYLVDYLGTDVFREGVREYIRKYLYANATWEDLIAILDSKTNLNLRDWSKVWVGESSMPDVSVNIEDNSLIISQSDPLGRGFIWPQNLDLCIYDGYKLVETIEQISLDKDRIVVPCPGIDLDQKTILLNMSGRAYGHFVIDEQSRKFVMSHYKEFDFRPAEKMSLFIQLNEEMLRSRVQAKRFAEFLLGILPEETDPLLISLGVSYLKNMALHSSAELSSMIEEGLWAMSVNPSAKECNQLAFRALLGVFRSEQISDTLYDIWENQILCPQLKLNDRDYMKLAYELSLRKPEKYSTLIETQASRLSNPDLKREFEFISRAVDPSRAKLDSLFLSLSVAENRLIEPWTAQVLAYLNHSVRQEEAVKYIVPALELMEDVQRTGDIFFPTDWADATLKGHNSLEAQRALKIFLEAHPDYPSLLKYKILQAGDCLLQSFYE